jgi:signal transduction protein with GAF and PtsI domain
MSPSNLLKVKSVVRRISYKQSKELLNKALKMEHSHQIKELLEGLLSDVGAHRLLNPAVEAGSLH